MLRQLALAVAMLSTLACTPKDSASGATTDASTSAPKGATAAKSAAVPANVCALFKVAEVEALLGEKVEAKDVPGGGCQFAGGTRTSLYPTVSIAEDFAGAGGIEGAKTGAQAAAGGTATPLTVGGATGFVVTGQRMAGATITQAGVAHRGLLVTVTMSGGEKAKNEKVASKLLEMALPKL